MGQAQVEQPPLVNFLAKSVSQPVEEFQESE